MNYLNHVPHADDRYFERYGKHLNEEDYEDILNKIKNGEGKLISSQDEKKVYRLRWSGNDVILVIDYLRNLVITFLPNGFDVKTNKLRAESGIDFGQIWKLKSSSKYLLNFSPEVKILRRDSFTEAWVVEKTDGSYKKEKILEESIKKYYKLKGE